MKLLLENWKNYLVLEQQAVDFQSKLKALIDRLPEASLYQSRPGVVGSTYTKNAIVNNVKIEGQIMVLQKKDCSDAYKIKYVTATKGWGALLYELALEGAGPNGLIADRDSTSASAVNVWNIYMQRTDVKKVPLDINNTNCTLRMLHHYLDDNLNPVTPPEGTRIYSNTKPSKLNRWGIFLTKDPQEAAKFAANNAFGNIFKKENKDLLEYAYSTKKITNQQPL
jgi:hypothetical protein